MKVASSHRLAALLATVIVVLVGLSAAAAQTTTGGNAAKADAAGQKADPIIIGRVIGRTGFLSPYDGPPSAGMDIAIKKINARGGVLGRPLKVVEVDTKSDVNLVATGAVEALSKGAEIMVTTCDFDYGGPAALEASKKNVVAISLCAGSLKFGPLGIGPLAYTMGAPAPTYGAANAEWAFNKKKWRRAYVLLDTTILFTKEECAGFEQRWKELGGTIVGKDTFQQKDVSIRSQVTRLKNAGQIDFIYPCSYQPGSGKSVKQLRDAGVDTPILANGDWDGNYWKPAVPKATNIFFSTYGSIFGDDPTAKVNAFFKKYKQVTGKPPVTSYPLLGYALVEVLQRGISRAKTTDGPALAAKINAMKREPLLIGPSTFSPKFHSILYRPLRIMNVTNGKTRFVAISVPTKVPDTSKVK